MRRRTRARELALQFLYVLDSSGDETRPELEEFLKDSGAARPTLEFAVDLVDGVRTHRGDIDTLIRDVAAHWKLERIARVDRNILRMSIYELLHRSDIPYKVTLNEAIELGKRYSTAQSGSFINGILDRIRELHGLAEPEPDPPPDPGSESEPQEPEETTP